MSPAPSLFALPSRAQLVSEAETLRWLERVEEVKKGYTPKCGYLAQERKQEEEGKP